MLAVEAVQAVLTPSLMVILLYACSLSFELKSILTLCHRCLKSKEIYKNCHRNVMQHIGTLLHIGFSRALSISREFETYFWLSYISIDVELSNLKLYNTMVIGNTWWRIFLHYIFFFTFSIIPMKYELVWGRIKKVKHFSSGRNSKT